jgi:catechol 2,3-dioxygenase-like lactoylglutathione lyase family enzyme
MIDHTGVSVSDLEKSKAFYSKALAPIGYTLLMDLPQYKVCGFGEAPKPDFWIGQGEPNKPALHVAFRTNSRKIVDAFYEAALRAGGKDNGAPGLRPHYHADYYGAFVLDPDGHNIEVVCHTPV